MTGPPAPDPDDGLDVELYCRTTTATASAVDRYHSRLEALQAAGVVDAVTVESWPSRVEFSTGTHDDVVETYGHFESWADAAGVDLDPAFDRREYVSEFTGEEGTALVTPVACLAAYDGGDLTAVYPHTAEEGTRTVEDALDALASRGEPAPDLAPDATVAVGGSRDR